jgi:hypothetical protein
MIKDYSEMLGTIYDSTPPPAPAGTTAVADIHSHGAYLPTYDSNNFSTGPGGDLQGIENDHHPGYVTTPDGSLKQYDPDTKTVTPIQENMPSDPNDPQRKNRIN